jgi:hypothetical protein
VPRTVTVSRHRAILSSVEPRATANPQQPFLSTIAFRIRAEAEPRVVVDPRIRRGLRRAYFVTVSLAPHALGVDVC